MEPSRPDAPHSFAACSRVFFTPDVFSEMMGRQTKSSLHRSSVSARGPANQLSCGVTDKAARDFTVDFAFLPAGKRYSATIWRDGAGGGIDGDPFAMAIETKTVTAATTWPVRMAAGGGFAIALTPAR